MDCSLDKVSIHQFSFLNEVFFILIFKVFHLFVLAFYGLADANESFQLRNFGFSIILIHIFKVFEEFIENIFIFFDWEIFLCCLFDVFDDRISKPIFLVCFDKHCFLQKRWHLFPSFILVKVFLLKQISDSVSHSSCHFELALIV